MFLSYAVLVASAVTLSAPFSRIEQALSGSTYPLIASETFPPLPLESFLPPKLHDWVSKEEPTTYDARTLSRLVDGAAETFIAYRCRAGAVRTYTRGDVSLTVEIFDMTTRAGSFGLCTVQKFRKLNALSTRGEIVASEKYAEFWKRNFFCRVYSDDPIGKTTLEELARLIFDSLPGDTALPQFVKLFPSVNLVSVRYYPRNVYGVECLQNAVELIYRIKSKEVTFLLAELPERRSAKRAFKACLKILVPPRSVQKKGLGLGEQSVLYDDPRYGQSIFARLDRFLLAFFGTGDLDTVTHILKTIADRLAERTP